MQAWGWAPRSQGLGFRVEGLNAGLGLCTQGSECGVEGGGAACRPGGGHPGLSVWGVGAKCRPGGGQGSECGVEGGGVECRPGGGHPGQGSECGWRVEGLNAGLGVGTVLVPVFDS